MSFLPLTRLCVVDGGCLAAVRGSGKSTHPRPWGSAVGLILGVSWLLTAERQNALSGCLALYCPCWGVTGRRRRTRGLAAESLCLLSTRALVFLGLISYPLYLWHWPALALVRIIDGPNATGMTGNRTCLPRSCWRSGHILVDRTADTDRQRPRWRHPAGACHGAGAVGRFAGQQRKGFQATPYERSGTAEAIQRLAAADWQYPGPSFVRERGRLGDGWVDRRTRPAQGACVRVTAMPSNMACVLNGCWHMLGRTPPGHEKCVFATLGSLVR